MPSIRPSLGDEEEEAPLDPALERLRVKMRRLVMVSTLTMLFGIAAVLVAVIYRINRDGGKSQGDATIAAVLPADARVLAQALDGDRLALTIETGGETRVLLIDLAAGALARTVTLGRQ